MGMQQGLSGLNATSTQLDVIGNNIANANTYGAKASRAEFAGIYANAIGAGGSGTVGIGVTVEDVSQQFTQGNITSTANPLDLAINGSGFFQLNSAGTTVYSRNGQFKLDSSGYLVNANSQQLLGYAAAVDGTIIPSSVQPLQLPTAGVAPGATSKVALEINLDSRTAVTLPAAAPAINFTDPATYNNATSTTLFDAKGQSVAVNWYFQKSGNDQWNLYATANGQSLAVDASGNPQPVAANMTFKSDGSGLTSPAAPVSINVPSVALSGGGVSLPINGIALDLGRATQYGSAFTVTNMSQDGYAPGQLASVSIDKSGIITAKYSNGQTKSAGQLVLAGFRNAQGLQPQSGNVWTAGSASGDPIIGAAGSGNLGVIQSGALEESNVDLTGELVALITAQRAYQANAQTIKGQDQIMQTLVNL